MTAALMTRPADVTASTADIPAELVEHPDLFDVAGDLDAELDQQRIGQEVAVLTGMPGLSSVHCLTVCTEEEYLPTM